MGGEGELWRAREGRGGSVGGGGWKDGEGVGGLGEEFEGNEGECVVGRMAMWKGKGGVEGKG